MKSTIYACERPEGILSRLLNYGMAFRYYVWTMGVCQWCKREIPFRPSRFHLFDQYIVCNECWRAMESKTGL